MLAAAYVVNSFDGGADNAEYSAVGGEDGKVFLLYGSQGFGRCRIAGEDYQRTSFAEEAFDGLEGEAINHFKRSGSVWGACVVAKIEVII